MRVLELTDEEGAAAFCGRAFVHSGATVVRVERPDRPAPSVAADTYLNGGKQRVALDYRVEADRRAIEELARRCDVVVMDVPVRDLDAYRLIDLGGPTTIRVTVTPFGLSGPYRDWIATDATLLALAGHTWLAGDPDREPLGMPWRYGAYQSGQFAYIAARAELLRDEPAERVSHVEISVLECLSSLHQGTDTMWTSGHQIRSRNGNTFHQGGQMLLPCHDGWYEVSAGQAFWVQFATMIGRPEFLDDPRFNTVGARMKNYGEVQELTTESLMSWPVERIMREGQEVWRVPFGYVATLGGLLEDQQLDHMDFWRPISGRPDIKMPGLAVRIAGDPRPEEPPPARVGADTAVVIEEMRRSGAVENSGGAHQRLPYRPPLAGVRILDLTRVWAGPLATRILGDLGAEVIKVEAPVGRGTETATEGNPRPWNQQALFNKLNRNKRSIAVDLKQEQGRDLFLRLVEKSDVVIENFSPRAMPSLGLGYEQLSAVNGRIIYVAMPAFGLSGPRRDYIGFGSSIEPSSGLTALMGYGPEEPRVTLAGVTDAMAGTIGVGGLLEALDRRKRTGKGMLLELAQQQAGMAFIGEHLIERQLTGHEPERRGNSDPRFAPYGVYPCAGDDQWIAIGTRTDVEWLAFCEVAGRNWQGDARFADLGSRLANRKELDELIAAWTRDAERWELTRILQLHGVAAAPVLNAPDWLADGHLADREYWVDLEHAEAGRARWDGSPFRFDGDHGMDHWFASSTLGGDNDAVLRGILGMSESQVASLWANGTVTDRPPIGA